VRYYLHIARNQFSPQPGFLYLEHLIDIVSTTPSTLPITGLDKMGATHSTQTPHTLNTSLGSLKGILVSDSAGKPIYTRYTRIPYALPPTGTLRFRKPQPLPKSFSFNASDSSAGDHTKFGPICPQPVYATGDAMVSPAPKEAAEPVQNSQDEDCLYVNVWVPWGQAPEEGWPVQFYIRTFCSLPLAFVVSFFSISTVNPNF
jgi:hypothetical protein